MCRGARRGAYPYFSSRPTGREPIQAKRETCGDSPRGCCVHSLEVFHERTLTEDSPDWFHCCRPSVGNAERNWRSHRARRWKRAWKLKEGHLADIPLR